MIRIRHLVDFVPPLEGADLVIKQRIFDPGAREWFAPFGVQSNSLTACVLVLSEGGVREVRKKEFPTFWKGLQNLKL